MDAQHARVIDYFDQCHGDYRLFWGTHRHGSMHAGYYDARHRTHDAAQDNANRILADLAGVRPGDRVLDAGCGVGGSAAWLVKHRRATVVGVNLNATQLRLARQLADRHGLDGQVRLIHGDYCSTPLPDASFDVVWGLESVCYAPDKFAFLAEAFRLLRPGGRLVVADAFLTRPPRCHRERSLIEGWCRGWAVPNVPTVTDFAQALRSAGYRDVEAIDGGALVGPASRRMWLLAVVAYPLSRVLEWLGVRSAVQTGNVAAGWYQYHVGRLGLGAYVIFRAVKP